MNKEQRNKLLEELQKDSFYSGILSSVKNESERKRIKSFSEEIYLSLVESLTSAIILEEKSKESIPNE